MEGGVVPPDLGSGFDQLGSYITLVDDRWGAKSP